MKWNDLKRKYNDQLSLLSKQSPYELLGVDARASAADIRTAYRTKIKIYHPDTAHTFMRQYHAEVTKLLTAAFKAIKGESHDVQ